MLALGPMDFVMRFETTVIRVTTSKWKKNEDGWLVGVKNAPWDQWEGSNGHKSMSRKADTKIMTLEIYIDGFYFPDCEQKNVRAEIRPFWSGTVAVQGRGGEGAVQGSPAGVVLK